ncbi:hypothetical protein MTP99_019705 [Tenebrio molitor]|nr:hypothetical protein MTP99_019705 [Tenebrio molitor]
MWRRFGENYDGEEMVDVETIFDNNEENEAGLKKKHRKHYSNDAKEIIRNVNKHLLESGCKAVKKQSD